MNPVLDWLEDNFDEVEPRTFYRTIFPEGELERKGECVRGKYVGIIIAITSDRRTDGRRKVKRYTLTDELDALDLALNSDDFCLCSPLSYAGKQRTAENARKVYAIAVDVDMIRMYGDEPLGLINLWTRHIEAIGRIPRPTFIVSSGSGVHLYYVLSEPVSLYGDMANELQAYKRQLTRLIWHDTIVKLKSGADVQQEGIFQGFRIPGTITKYGTRAKAFLTGERVTIEYLNEFVPDGLKIKRKPAMSLAEAAEKYPEWYERRVIRKEPPKRKMWAVNRRLYEWWKWQVYDGAREGHRYFCVMALAIYAAKCSKYDPRRNPNPVTREELEKDSFEMLDYLDSMTDRPDNHFTADDILSALEAFNDNMVMQTRASIERKTGISIPARKDKGLSQREHLEEARAIRDVRAKRRGQPWDAGGGRKSKLDVVQRWRKENPNGRKVDCIKATGLSKPTVYKHWDACKLDE